MAGRGPLNYTTTIDPAKSAGECIAMLARYGATAIGITYDTGRPTGLTFQIKTRYGPRQYSLPCNIDGTHQAMSRAARRRDIPPRYAGDRAQSERVAWRVVKDWLEVQLALIEAGVADIEEALIGFMHVEHGRTVYQVMNEHQLAIGSSES